jgi:hypothetical protein
MAGVSDSAVEAGVVASQLGDVARLVARDTGSRERISAAFLDRLRAA